MAHTPPQRFDRTVQSIIAWTAVFALIAGLTGSVTAQPPELNDAFGEPQMRAAAETIASVAGDAARAHFEQLDRPSAAAYLDSFWVSRNNLLHRYYFGHYLGRRGYSISDAFFERDDLIPKAYVTGYPEPDAAKIHSALLLADDLVRTLPADPVAWSARGYLRLEAGRSVEAEADFVQAVKIDERFAEAHNGWGLSYLPQKKRMMEALYHFRDAVALDADYSAAFYDLAMCHLAMGSIDLDHRFGTVAQKFPRHRDAFYKLGVTHEKQYQYQKAAGAYSNQLIVYPDHQKARLRLARVNLEMSWTTKRFNDVPEIEAFVEKDPVRYLPLLAETHLAKHNYEAADQTYDRYFKLIRGDQRDHYEDITLLLTEEERDRWEVLRPGERRNERTLFWLMQDPTPTTTVNERRLEHYRRVHYALGSYGLGQKPWDRRGEVYIRLGHPDHRSWSGNIVFETDPGVLKVKNRLNDRTYQVRGEIMPDDLLWGGDGLFASREMGEIRGLPVFPIPHSGSKFRDGATLDARWESWIYASVGGGIELTFVDYTGNGRFDFARVPHNSSYPHIWIAFAPETVFTRATKPAPSSFEFDYGGTPLTIHLDHATFRGESRSPDLELYFGVPWEELGLEQRGDDLYARYDRVTVIFDGGGSPVYRDSLRLERPRHRKQDSSSGSLSISQLSTPLPPGDYVIGSRIRDPGTARTQVLRKHIVVSPYPASSFSLSEVEVACVLDESAARSEFSKGDLLVVPLPSRTFRPGKPIYLYYEVYGLLRDQNGETRYRVSYRIEGGKPGSARRFGDRIARILGEKSEEAAEISYIYEGIEPWEPLYVALDLVDANVGGDIRIDVTVTDLKRLDEPSVTRTVNIKSEDE